MSASAIIVHFHAAELAGRALRSFRDDAQRQGLSFEALIVDNGSTDAERVQLEALDATILDPAGNRSYSAGLNAGVRASSGELLLLANADIEILPGCLGALRQGLDAGLAATGPRFFLDHAGAWLQPPADRRTVSSEVASLCAQAGIGSRIIRSRWRKRAHTFWSAETPLPMRQLSGALLAVHRDTWDRVGEFDESYRLYFEETDWLMRLAASGGRAGLVPAARAVHLWGQSTRHEPRAASWFEESAHRFRRRWYGTLGTRFLEAVQRALPAATAATAAAERAGIPPTDEAQSRPAWVELAASHTGFPAAGHRVVHQQIGPIPDLPPHLPASRYCLRGVSRAGKDLWCRAATGVG